MAQINPPRPLTATRAPETREDTVVTAASRGTEFFEDHRTAILATIAGVAALALAVTGWNVWQDRRSEEGQQLLGAILTEYEAGNYQTALDGTDTAPGLLEIADEYGSTATGEQATFFAADALYQLGRFDEALARFEDYDGGGLLAASALAGQAAIAEQTGDAARAARLYEQAAAEVASPASTPGYLLDAARAHLAAGDAEAAQGVLQRIADEWEDGPEARAAEVEMGQAVARATASGQATGGVRPAPARADTTAAAPAAVGAPTAGPVVEPAAAPVVEEP